MRPTFAGIWLSSLHVLVVLALCVGTFAQGGAGELTGQVTDTTGAVVAGVEVKLSNSATGEVRTTTTTSGGVYRFPELPIVGTYALEIKAKGFKGVKVQDIIATVGQVTTRDVKVEVGTTTEEVTVEAGEQLVQTEDAALSNDVDRRVWQDMPLEDRSQNSFIALLPGAEPATNAMLGTDRGAAVNGARSGAGNFMVDGFDNNDQALGGAQSVGTGPGGANTQISPDAIQEYRVIDSVPPAEYGKAGGFVTDTVLKSGTNQWHGSLFEYNRIQALAANSFFSNFSDTEDHLVRNQFGGSIGGPIIKDRTFFFFTAEAQRLRYSNPLSVDTTTQAFVNDIQNGTIENFLETSSAGMCNNSAYIANFNAIFGTTAAVGPCTGMIPVALGNFFSKITAPGIEPIPLCGAPGVNCTNLTANAEGLYTGGQISTPTAALPVLTYPDNVYGTVNVPQPVLLNQMRYSTRVDHKLGPNDQLSGDYLYDNAPSTSAFAADNVYGPTLYNQARAQNAGITWTHTISPTVLNQARFDYVRNTNNFTGSSIVAGAPATISYLDSPNIGLGLASNLPQYFTENQFRWSDSISITHGKHNFKTGAELRRTRNGSSFDAYKYGYNEDYDIEDVLTDATFSNSVENHFLGGPFFGGMYTSTDSLDPTTGQLPVFYRGFRANEFAAYLQDSWRTTSRLTLNLGLRWEYFGPPHNFERQYDANFYTGYSELVANPCPTTPNPSVCGGSIANPFWLPSTSPYWGSFATGAVQQRTHDLWNKDLGDYGPRFGFAYDVLGNQKAVVRGGFGISYDRMYNNIFENLRFNPTPYYAAAEIGHFSPSGIPVSDSIASSIVTWPFTGISTFAGLQITPELRAMDQNLRTAYYEQAHFGVQYQLAKDMVLESNYVGTFGHRLIGVIGRNNYDGQYIGGLYASSSVNPLYGAINFRTNCCDSNYSAWQTMLRKRFSSGLQFNANYTYAKAMDDISDAFTTKGELNAYPTDSENPKFDYGLADFDVRQRLVASFVYDLPFAKSNRWIGGWNVSGIVSWQTGPNYSVTSTAAMPNEDGIPNQRANYIGPGKITNAIDHNLAPWRSGYVSANNFAMLNTAALPCPAGANMGLWCEGAALGQMERNTLAGPGYVNEDIGIKKTFKLTESAGLRFEANFFNLFNHPNFVAPVNNLNTSNFGQSTATFNNQESGGPRITQLALRFDF
jgi:outer membrane receptor protein involved in Fe transport